MADSSENALAAIEAAESNAWLTLVSGARLRVDVSHEGLKSHFAQFGVAIDGAIPVEVFFKPVQMTETEWRLISSLLRAHPDAVEALRPYKKINAVLKTSFADVCALHYRIYSGISSLESPSLFLSHPFDFYPKDGGHYCLLSERNTLIKCLVKYRRYAVTIEDDEIPGHFLAG